MSAKKITTIVIAALVALALTAALVVGILWDKNSDNRFIDHITFGFSNFSGNDDYLLGAGEALGSNIQKLNIYWISGDVIVTPSKDDKIHFWEENTENLKGEELLCYLKDGHTLTIKFSKKIFFSKVKLSSDTKKVLHVELPELVDCSLNIHTVSADLSYSDIGKIETAKMDSVSGKTNIQAATFKNLTIDTVSGKVRTECTVTDKLDIDSTSGSITVIGNVTALDADSVSGDLTFSGSASWVEFDTTSGKADLSFTENPDKIEMDSVSGSAKVTLPKDCGFELEMESVSGKAYLDDQSIGKDRKEGNGKCEISMDSVSGDMKIYFAS